MELQENRPVFFIPRAVVYFVILMHRRHTDSSFHGFGHTLITRLQIVFFCAELQNTRLSLVRLARLSELTIQNSVRGEDWVVCIVFVLCCQIALFDIRI